MSDLRAEDSSLANEAPHETAARIADQIAPLMRQTRARGFGFLAYLLGMVLKEARRLTVEREGG